MAIVISVKYNGPTNTKGSRWTATMSDNRFGGKLRATVPYDYQGRDSGILKAAHAVLAKWDALVDFGRAERQTEIVGEDHNGLTIVKAWCY